ncbi:MAG: tripartite tricarboxylate transporter substrate-binding protein, partial [Chloroflexota bacterium]|nr:tripartite tricarboxylate transporter substrate-binding protein [Chloroflexota bacterium]
TPAPTVAPTAAPTKAPATAPTAAPTAVPTAAPTKPTGPTAAEFFKGKVVNLIVPFSPGGGFDQYPRLAQPALEAAMPGTAVVVQNVTGAGGIVGSNQIYRAAPDGLTIGIGNIGGLAFAAATGVEGVQYDLGKYSWFGRVYAEPRAVVVNSKGTIKTVADLKKLNRPVLAAATGVGSDDYYVTLVLIKGLGIPVKMATGYTSQPEANLGILRGEVDVTVSSLGGVRSSVDGGDLQIMLFIANAPVKDFEKVPLAKDQGLTGESLALVDSEYSVLELERSFIGPPGIPADRVEFLRAAFNKVFTDQATLDILTKAKRPVVWLDGKTCEQKILGVVANSKLLSEVLKAEMAK